MKMNATQARPPARKDAYSFSLKKIIQDVEARSGRKFSGPELDHYHKAEHRYPRATHQVVLGGEAGAPGASIDQDDLTTGAGGAPEHRSAPENTEQGSARMGNARNGPESAAPPKGCDVGHVSAVLSLLPQIPHLGDEAFLFLYLNISADFERRFGIQGWYERVLTMAAQGRK
jgi:hypothetical protein